MIQMKNKRCNKLNMDLFCTFYTTYLPESVSNYKIQACLGTALVSFPRHRIGCSVQSRTSGLGPRHADRPSGGRPQTNLHTVLAEPYSQRTLKETSKKTIVFTNGVPAGVGLFWPVDHQLRYILYSHFRNMSNSTNYSNTTARGINIHHIYRGEKRRKIKDADRECWD